MYGLSVVAFELQGQNSRVSTKTTWAENIHHLAFKEKSLTNSEREETEMEHKTLKTTPEKMAGFTQTLANASGS